MLNIFVNTWGNYNENGADGGEWITLPMDENELGETLERIASAMGDNDPEWAIHDYEWTSEIEPREISEYENIQKLNEEINDLISLDEWDVKEICAAMEAFGYTFMEAMEKVARGCFVFYAEQDLRDVAEDLVNDYFFTRNTPDFLTRYFDYEAFARDLSLDGYAETKYGVIVE